MYEEVVGYGFFHFVNMLPMDIKVTIPIVHFSHCGDLVEHLQVLPNRFTCLLVKQIVTGHLAYEQ